MRRIFTIGETVFYDDHASKRGWGKIILINNSNMYKEEICSDNNGDTITIRKERSKKEVTLAPSQVYNLARGRKFWGNRVVWEHSVESNYPFYCPDRDENCYHFEVE